LDCGGKAERDAALEKDKPGWFASESAVAAALRLGRLPAQSKNFRLRSATFR
jgi:hypothetical protein